MNQRPLLVRVGLVALGTIMVLAGLVGLFVPIMPGWLLIIPGLALLAGEFVWARRLLDGAKSRLDRIRGRRSGSSDSRAA